MMTSRSQLLGLFYSEFDNTTGPRVLFEAPAGVVSSRGQEEPRCSLFDAVSDYAITGSNLCGHELTVQAPAFGVQVMNYPLAVLNDEGKRTYARNALLFSVGVVLRTEAHPEQFSAVLRKLALTLHAIEVESGFLSDEHKKAALAELLPVVLHDLNSQGECTVLLNEANLLFLRLPPSAPGVSTPQISMVPASQTSAEAEAQSWTFGVASPPASPSDKIIPAELLGMEMKTSCWPVLHRPFLQHDPRSNSSSLTHEVGEEDVPVLLCSCERLLQVDCDLAIHRLLPHIDGVKCVGMIAAHAKMDVDCVQRCVGVLVWRQCVAVVDMFRYRNVYAVGVGIHKLLASPALAEDLLAQAVEFAATSPPDHQHRRHRHYSTSTTADGSQGHGSHHNPTAPSLGREHVELQRHEAGRAQQQQEEEEEEVVEDVMMAEEEVHEEDEEEEEQEEEEEEEDTLTPDRVLRFIEAFGNGLSVRELLQGAPELFPLMDHRRMVAFAVIHGLLQRLHSYPLLPAHPSTTTPSSPSTTLSPTTPAVAVDTAPAAADAARDSSGSLTKTAAAVRQMMNGKHNTDQILCRHCISDEELDEIVAACRAHIVVR